MELNIEAIKAAARAPNDHPPPDPAAVLALIERLEAAEAELRRIHVEQAEAVGFKP